jgi:hypothetical protein
MRTTLLVVVALWCSQAGADPWSVIRTTHGANGGTGSILPGADFNIAVPLPGSEQWMISDLDTADANTLMVLNSSTAASYGVDWEALSTAWSNPVKQDYFVYFTQGSSSKYAPFFPGRVNVAAGTTLNSVDFRFSYTMVNGSTPSLKFSTTTQFHAEGAPEPGSLVLLLVAVLGLSLFRHHTPHPARR